MKCFIDKYWTDRVRFLTYAENELFIAAICERIIQSSASSVSSSVSSSDEHIKSPITEEDLHEILVNIETVSTIKGAVRDEYCASEMLSRV